MQEKIELEINLTERQRIVFMQLFKLENDTELLQTIYNLGIKSAESILVSNMENELNKLINDVEEYNNKRNVFTEALKYLQKVSSNDLERSDEVIGFEELEGDYLDD